MFRVPKISRLTRVARAGGVDVYVHLSVFLIAAVVLAGSLRSPVTAVIGMAAFLSVMLLHEAGHLAVARRMGYEPRSIELYPMFGFARFEQPESRFDRAAIAWGGVAAQAAVGIPVALGTALLGYTPFAAVNAALVILGSFSLFLAAFNLLPFYPLDGVTAWDAIPAYLERRRTRRRRRAPAYRSPR